MASRKRTTAKAGKRAVVMGKSKPNGKPLNGRPLNGKHAKHVNGKSNGAASVLAVQVPKVRKDHLKSKAQAPVKRGDTVKSQIVLPVGYRPTDDEPFMNERQRIYFRKKLLTWREEIIHQTRETLQGLHEDSSQHADIADRATFETDRALELRARDRQRKLISKIDSAIARIDDGSYGYCEETGEPISLKRLDARPIATLSLEAQERHERRERVFRED
jgi:DnaK suppressor protein